MATHMIYDIAVSLTPMVIFAMIGRPVDHKAMFELVSHSLALGLDRFTGANLLTIATASNYIGFSARHFYLLPSSNLDERRLWFMHLQHWQSD